MYYIYIIWYLYSFHVIFNTDHNRWCSTYSLSSCICWASSVIIITFSLKNSYYRRTFWLLLIVLLTSKHITDFVLIALSISQQFHAILTARGNVFDESMVTTDMKLVLLSWHNLIFTATVSFFKYSF